MDRLVRFVSSLIMRGTSVVPNEGTGSRFSTDFPTNNDVIDKKEEYDSGVDADTEEDTQERLAARGQDAQPRRARSRSRQRSRSRDRLAKSKPPVNTEDVVVREVPIEKNVTVEVQDEQFEQMKNDAEVQLEWNKRFPAATIVLLETRFVSIVIDGRFFLIYTDGSCWNNSASGYGIYHGPGHALNRSHRIEGPIHNSGLAEILAATTALEDLRNWRQYSDESVIVRTDYLPLVQAMIKGNNGKSNRFAAQYGSLRDIASTFRNGVQFQHVYGHDGDPGNEAADELARQAMESQFVAVRPQRSCSEERQPRSRIRDRSMERGRSASRNNARAHIRSHSAFVRGSSNV